MNGYLKSDPTQNYGQINGRTQSGTANLTMNLDNPPSTPSGAFDLNLKADLGEGVSVTINDLRRSIKLQEWLERNARGGARYIEQIFSHFGVKSSDARLQRAEFLGGGKTPVMISEVLQTSGSPSPDSPLTETPLATMAGHGISVGSTHEFTRFFEEHGIIMGIMSVMPKTAYQQGTPRMFTKFDKFDYYFLNSLILVNRRLRTKSCILRLVNCIMRVHLVIPPVMLSISIVNLVFVVIFVISLIIGILDVFLVLLLI